MEGSIKKPSTSGRRGLACEKPDCGGGQQDADGFGCGQSFTQEKNSADDGDQRHEKQDGRDDDRQRQLSPHEQLSVGDHGNPIEQTGDREDDERTMCWDFTEPIYVCDSKHER